MTTIDGDDVRAKAADWAGEKALAAAAPPRTARRVEEESFILGSVSVAAPGGIKAKRYAQID